jgi:hypothetical protein
MVLNIDETSVSVRPAAKYTFAQEGSVQVPVVAHGDKKQLTVTLATSITADKLSAQLIYAGKTRACVPKEAVPGVHYSYSLNHWQNLDTTKDFLNSCVFPYFKKKREELGLGEKATGLIIWDIWWTHVHVDIVALCDANNVKMVIVPPGYTSDLQLLDLYVNHIFKKLYQKEFQNW